MAPGQILRDAIFIGGVNLLGGPEAATALGALGGEQMALAGAGAHDFSGAGDFESFGYRFPSSITFGASHKFTFSTKERAL
jgi:hypothetical protein